MPDAPLPAITPVILCGGSGTRLWPLSRNSYPKQFAPLVGEHSLYQQTASRLSGDGFNPAVIVTNSDFRFIVTQQLSEVGLDAGAVLIEPAARNTAPALLAAALYMAQTDPQSLMLATPSDHYIDDNAVFCASVRKGTEAALNGQIVTLGVQPSRAETGYGYLELGTPQVTQTEATPLRRFVEKPDAPTAAKMIESGQFLWNAGVYLYTAQSMIDAFRKYAPDMLEATQDAVRLARPDLGFLRLDPGAWDACDDISIDFAIMEKADNLSVVAHHGSWSDLGGWEAVWQLMETDNAGVALHGPALAVDCSETLLRSESDGLQLVGLGLNNIVAVAMDDAVLVADRSRVADLGKVVKDMRNSGIAQTKTFPRHFRPWGFFETLTLHSRFRVKRIVVHAGAALSLQSHVHRSEHWVVVAGTAEVTIGDTVSLVSENQSVYIPLGTVHRLRNPGKLPMELIEVQTGAYLEEDDITRYEDEYDRG